MTGQQSFLLLFVSLALALDTFSKESMVRFDEQKPRVSYFALDEDGEPGENALIVNLTFLRELDDAMNLVSSIDISTLQFDFLYSSPDNPTISGGLRYSHGHQVIYSNPLTGAQFVFWLFTADQTVVDIASGDLIPVKSGRAKFSMVVPFFPFASPTNILELPILIQTEIPDSIFSCAIPEDTVLGTTAVVCDADQILTSGVLLTSGVATNVFTGERSVVNVDVDFFVCPMQGEQDITTPTEGFLCPIALEDIGSYPTSYEEGEDDDCTEKEVFIEVLEIRLRIDNFQFARLDYDPELSVLFRGEGSGGGCSSSNNNSLIAWISLALLIVAILFVVAVITVAELFYQAKMRNRRLFITSISDTVQLGDMDEIRSQQ